MSVVCTLTLFLGGALLYGALPVVGKMLMPALGGTPAAWTISIAFFQAALLAGVVYSEVTRRWFGLRRQILVHGCLLLAPLALLPLGLRGGVSWADDADPMAAILRLLAVSVGLPLFVTATTGTLLQSWLASQGNRRAGDVWMLSAVGQLGGALALVSYPALIEPHLTLDQQAQLWAAGFGLLVMLVVASGFMAVARRRRTPTNGSAEREIPGFVKSGPALATRLHWLALAFVPASLTLSVTTQLTTHVGTVSFFWVIPLAITLLTYLLAFTCRAWLSPNVTRLLLPPAVVGLALLIVSGVMGQLPLAIVLPAQLVALLGTSLVCCSELARTRPDPDFSGTFFLWLSLGGLLGSAFNLTGYLYCPHVMEYSVALTLACFLVPPRRRAENDEGQLRSAWSLMQGVLDVLLPAALGGLTMGLLLTLASQPETVSSYAPWLQDLPPVFRALAVYAVPLLLCFTFAVRRVRFGLGMGVVIAACAYCEAEHGGIQHRARSFYGDVVVRHDAAAGVQQLMRSGVAGGMQSLNAARRGEALGQHHRSGPVGDVFAARSDAKAPRHVAVAGLGVGSLLSYATKDQDWTAYEIDPAVCRTACDPQYFTYVRDAQDRGVQTRFVLGDVRRNIAQANDQGFDLLFVDAFAAESIPVHLLTRQAFALYRTKLAKQGWLIVNISNRHLKLEPVLAALAEDAGLAACVRHDPGERDGKAASTWVVLAPSLDDLAPLRRLPGWRPAQRQPGVEPWTDHHANLWRVVVWR